MQAISDYNKWATDTGNKPLDVMSTMAALQDRDPNKSIADNEEAERRARSNERWERIGNVLSHLGNFVGTTAYGAPSQQLETGLALSARQKQLRDATIALRDKRNSAMMDAYLKDLAQKQTEKKEAQAYALAQRKQAAEEKKAAIEMQLRAAKDQREILKLQSELAKAQAEVNRIEELLPYEKRVKESTISRNYSSGGRRNNSAEYKNQLDKDFAEMSAKFPDALLSYEEKYGIYPYVATAIGNNGGGKRWDDNLKRQFVAEMKRKYGGAAESGQGKERGKKENLEEW